MNAPLATSLTTLRWQNLVLLLSGNILLALSSKISLPLLPVPVTLQTLAVLLIAQLYGYRLATATIGVYLLEGAAGLPVLAQSSWLTMGYLIGFLIAGGLCGYIAEYRRTRDSFTKAFAIAVLGDALILASGVAFMSPFLGLHAALTVGLKPFILIEILKCAFVAALVPQLHRATLKLHHR